MKLPKCTIGKTHSWEWVKNVTIIIQTLRTASFRKKGVYKCACGETKHGEPQ